MIEDFMISIGDMGATDIHTTVSSETKETMDVDLVEEKIAYLNIEIVPNTKYYIAIAMLGSEASFIDIDLKNEASKLDEFNDFLMKQEVDIISMTAFDKQWLERRMKLQKKEIKVKEWIQSTHKKINYWK